MREQSAQIVQSSLDSSRIALLVNLVNRRGACACGRVPSTFTEHMTTNLLRVSTVLDRFPVCRSTLYMQVQAGSFPPPVSIGRRSVAWLADEVQAVVRARASGVDDKQLVRLVRDLVVARSSFMSQLTPTSSAQGSAS